MATSAQVRTLLLSMPEAEEKSHFGQPDFRVRNKIFASRSPKVAEAWRLVAPKRLVAAREVPPRARGDEGEAEAEEEGLVL